MEQKPDEELELKIKANSRHVAGLLLSNYLSDNYGAFFQVKKVHKALTETEPGIWYTHFIVGQMKL